MTVVDIEKYMNNKNNLKKHFVKLHELMVTDHIGEMNLGWFNKMNRMPLFRYASTSVNQKIYVKKEQRLEKEAQMVEQLAEQTHSILDGFPNSLDEALKYLRKLDCFKMSQLDLAEKIGVSVSTIERLESKDNENKCSEEHFVKLCIGLGLNPILRDRLVQVTNLQFGNSLNKIKLKIILDDPYVEDLDSKIELLNKLGMRYKERKE